MQLQILVVDDIAESREALCALVRDLGHFVVGADSGHAALALMQCSRPDAVLLDLLMPDMDGFEVTRRMRELDGGRWMPVIVTSSLQGEEHFIHALENGADDFLARPVSAGLLRAKLRHYEDVLGLQSQIATLAQRQSDILDNILDPVLTLDASGRLEEFNRAAHTLADLHGRPLAAGATCRSVFGMELTALLAQRECRLRRVGGEEFVAELGLSEWRDQDRVHFTLVLRDLTEQRQVERMKDEFLATVSHELRTPLTSVLGALGLLAGGAAGALPPPALSLLEVARRNGTRLGRLIDDILDLTKLEGDRLVLHQRPQALAPLLREALSANQGYADRAGVKLASEGLDATPVEVRLDADRFQQVMANLLSNAIKHTPAGEAVSVTLAPAAQGVRVTVRDRGPGIDPRFRARMFEKFSQADGTDRRAQGGTGLGLYITRMLVERMGGRITADDVAQGGSFSLWFPANGAAPRAGGPVVLHVESDFEARRRVAGWLAPLCRVESAASLEQAAALRLDAPPALVVGNPKEQGAPVEFCTALRRLAGGRPVLLYGDTVDRAFCDSVGLPWLNAARSGPQDLAQAVLNVLGSAARPGANNVK
ncbi:ATP-binding response regulator [Azohydromonas aeria]|uniref:ATP-binding response regulator n=1 Tax=Azohydromonas aeria TaxID=2590212 RepID=UPI0012FA4847|nr:hybrid sensor histidine kinase/response regulator [Azohydromonas aeria]